MVILFGIRLGGSEPRVELFFTRVWCSLTTE